MVNIFTNSDSQRAVNNSPTIFSNPVYTIVTNPINSRWTALLRDYADAVFDCILQVGNSALYYLVLEIIKLRNDKIVSGFENPRKNGEHL